MPRVRVVRLVDVRLSINCNIASTSRFQKRAPLPRVHGREGREFVGEAVDRLEHSVDRPSAW